MGPLSALTEAILSMSPYHSTMSLVGSLTLKITINGYVGLVIGYVIITTLNSKEGNCEKSIH
jgi:hypothetical protein